MKRCVWYDRCVCVSMCPCVHSLGVWQAHLGMHVCVADCSSACSVGVWAGRGHEEGGARSPLSPGQVGTTYLTN